MNDYLQYKKSLAKFNPDNYGLASIDLNPTELCNRLCHFCPRSSFYPNLNLNMSLESADLLHRRLVEFDYQGAITIAGKGEPLLNNGTGFMHDNKLSSHIGFVENRGLFFNGLKIPHSDLQSFGDSSSRYTLNIFYKDAD